MLVMLVSFLGFFVIGWFFFAYNAIVFLTHYHSNMYTQKQLAHVTSCRTALALCGTSLFLNVTYWGNLAQPHQLEVVSITATLYFMAYLLFDITFGTLYYKRYMELLTGYIHHVVYLFISMYALITNNTYIYMMFFVEELPTFVLCLGKCNPQYRNNNLFGYSFLFLRILYHSVLIFVLLQDRATVLLALFPLGLHVHWFSRWFWKYVLLKAD
jgi:hypothetical protein